MKKLSYGVTLATFAAVILIVSALAATSQQKPGEMPHGKMAQHQEGRMGMSAMKQEPHHLLAMAYKDNLVSFAKALRHQATLGATVNPAFARAAVAEMKRSFDQMQEHHQDHMKTMDETMKAQMADKIKQMDAHHSAIQQSLAALDKETQTSAPDSKSIAKYVAEILKHCDGMAKMHGGAMGHKMAAPKEHKMN